MQPQQPVYVRIADLGWESWDDGDSARRGEIVWKTLFSGERTPTGELSAGLALVPPGGGLSRHRHAQAEIYVVLAGVGVAEIDGVAYTAETGTALFIPGGAWHSISNTSAAELRFLYAFAADEASQIVYEWA